MSVKKWFACELHCHTRHSDGSFTVSELLDTACRRGLEGICLTDHNTVSGWAEVQESRSPVVLCGIEWTTYYGHMLVLDCRDYVDWRDARPDNIDEKMKAVRDKGGLVGVAHPFELGTPICTGGYWSFSVEDWKLVNYMEIWSEGEPRVNTCNSRAIARWNGLLDRGFQIAPTFGRDWHNAKSDIYPSACTYLGCDSERLTPEEMKLALKRGNTVVSAGPLFYPVTDSGKTAGDTESGGEHEITFITDFSRLDNFSFPDKMEPLTIRLVTKYGEAAGEWDYKSDLKVITDFKKNHWYSAELWGKINGADGCMIAKASPIYTA